MTTTGATQIFSIGEKVRERGERTIFTVEAIEMVPMLTMKSRDGYSGKRLPLTMKQSRN